MSVAHEDHAMSARNRELLGLIPASLLVTAGFAGVFIQRSNQLSGVSLTYGLIFLGLCLAGHVVIRLTLPYADPYLFPLVAALACFGIVMVYRIDSTLARQQAQWFVLGLVLFAATIIVFRDYRKLERYRYIIVLVSLAMLRAATRPRDRLLRERRVPGDPDSGLFVLPADGVREDRAGHLPRQLPTRHP